MTWSTLGGRARLLFHLQALVRLVLVQTPFTLLAGAGLALAWSPVWAVGLGAAWLLVQVVLAIWLPSLAWERIAWALRDHDLLVAEGVVFRQVTAIPWARIQHVDVGQGPLERAFGLARLQIHTAAGAGADAVIPGLELATAEALRDRLVHGAGDDGV